MNDMYLSPDIDHLALRSQDAFVAALLSDGDSRLAIGAATGTNKYLCPPTPAPDLICASSCTASPVTQQGFRRAADVYARLVSGSDRLAQASRDISDRLVACFGATGLAQAILCPSGTDALLTASLLLAREQPGGSITAILPQPSETGTGVPLAATLRPFDGPEPSDVPLLDRVVNAVTIKLRTTDGLRRSDDQVAAAYAAASASVKGRRIVYLTHSTKTGLIAPIVPPKGADVIVDACQARIEPETIARYLRNGWPVVVTGSKFYGGPAFSGAVLFPSARMEQIRLRAEAEPITPAGLGTLLRWTAALDSIDAFAAHATGPSAHLRRRAEAITQAIAANPDLVPMPGLSMPKPGPDTGWSQIPSIFNFAIRDPADRDCLLPMPQVRRLHASLADRKVLLGQPVELGRFGGLRIAIGARDLLPGTAADQGLQDLFAALRTVIARR